ncbi:hypothetical protein [Yinghuangia sp. YIM S09857]|uniref:hypothetical protein n=1 Tax=Yinghuangia sp. YIM S09857 TaxID=3436929 RepID=UPI003F52D423
MHVVRLDAGGGHRPRAWHITPPGTPDALCGTSIDPVDPHAVDGITDADAHALHCADCLTAYAAAVTAAPA